MFVGIGPVFAAEDLDTGQQRSVDYYGNIYRLLEFAFAYCSGNGVLTAVCVIDDILEAAPDYVFHFHGFAAASVKDKVTVVVKVDGVVNIAAEIT